MIQEIAKIDVKPGSEEAFEAAVAAARPIFAEAAGCHGFELHRLVEEPSTYRLFVQWETLEHHTETFRSSNGFQSWRALAGPYFASPPVVVHSAVKVVLADPHAT